DLRFFIAKIVSILARINTGSSALVLIKMYNLDKAADGLISFESAIMMTNPLVEAELFQLEITQLPLAFKLYAGDGNSWNYRTAKNGFLSLDTKLRQDVLDVLDVIDDVSQVKIDVSEYLNARYLARITNQGFHKVSFKVLLPAFLAYLRLPKMRIKGDEQVETYLRIFDILGFDQTDPHKLSYLVNQIQTQHEVPLDLALQRIASTNDASNVSRPKRYKFWSFIASSYFVVVYLGLMIFGITGLVNLINHDILELDRPVVFVFPMSVYIAGALLCIFLILITKRKLKKKVFSRPFVSIALNPIRNFLKVLPYISRYKPTTKLILFQSLVICLSPCCPLVVLTLYYGVDYGQFSWSSLLNPFAVFALTLPFLFVFLSRYYWKHRILAENPVIELIAMHPQGRKLIGDTI
ncbi:MAG TPA: hypothetical protein VN843_10625, partial [Anaerolineales bacterium]|nr:hypothetical protein [Anaerolineales bacterium]